MSESQKSSDNAEKSAAPGCATVGFLFVVLATVGYPLYCFFFESPRGASPLFMLWFPGTALLTLIVAWLCVHYGTICRSRPLLVMGIAAVLLLVLSWRLMGIVDRNRTQLAVTSAETALRDIEPDLGELEREHVSCEVGGWGIIFQAPDGQAYQVFMTERGRQMVVWQITRYDDLSDAGRPIYNRSESSYAPAVGTPGPH